MELKTRVKIRRNKYNIILLIIGALSILVVFFKPEFFSLSVNKEFHKDIITLSSIFGGFSFTTYGIIIGLSSQEVMIKMERKGYTSPYYWSILISLFFIMLSLILSFLGLFIPPFTDNKKLAMAELITFLMAVLFFIASILNVMVIQRQIRKSIKKTFVDTSAD